MSRKVRNRIQRHRTQAQSVSRRSWIPEVAGLMLLVVAVLTSAGTFA